ncbi:MAG: hypothetical protein HUJ25_17845 [Crocinitomicaceae bacterium]|nr:hypothetical protein [Crocinitomicaceae bacterium]
MENYYFSIIDKIKISLLFLTSLIVTACSDIIEEDISNETVQVIIPQSNATLTTNNVHFKWEKLKGADSYRLRVVEPSFSSINTYILDSSVANTEFYYVLDPGDYEFMIRAENSAYETGYTGPIPFTVDSVSDLTGQLIPLLAPANNYYSNLSDLPLSWQSIYAAETYEVQVRSGADFNSSATILFTATGLTGTSVTTTGSVFTNEGEYSWGVKAVNQSSQSSFSSRTIYIDKTVPNDVSLTAPADASTSSSDTVVFYWSSGVDPGTINSPLSYKLELDNDPAFSSFSEYTTTVDSLQLILSTGTYYWRVYAIDEAGNQSVFYSSEYSVIIP